MKLFKPLTLLLIVLLSNNINGQNITINEIQSSNGNTIKDEDGDNEDWVELYNADSISVNLGGWKLSDNSNIPNKWTFPSVTIQPGEFLIIFTSGKNKFTGQYIHTNFSISAAGEPILLTRIDGVLIDFVPAIAIPRDHSYGRRNNGQNPFVFFDKPTPGSSNENGVISGPTNLLSTDIPSGFYTNEFSLTFTDNFDSTVKIYYTVDGSNPTINDSLFSDSIIIYDKSSEPNGISMIRTNPEFSKYGEITKMPWSWKEPKAIVNKGTTIKAQAFIEDSAVSAISTFSYFISPQGRSRYSFPVISITIPQEFLFDHDSGIYVPGAAYNEDEEWETYWGNGNYNFKGAEWEKIGHFCYIDTNNQVQINRNVGIRIQGSGSAALPIKSLRLYARPDFSSNNFNYAFFPNNSFKNFERIILRNSGQDFKTTYFLDAFTQKLIQDLDIETQDYLPTIVFINGEYWGIHNLRDRIDAKFLAYRKDIDEGNIDYIEYNSEAIVKEGNYSHYQNEVEFFIDANQQNLNEPTVYNHLDNVIDLRNHIDYTISKIYFGVYDWPGNNLEFWRERKAGSKYRWISYDNDDAFFLTSLNTLENIVKEGGTSWPYQDFATQLFRNLIKIDRYRDSFLSRFEFHMYNTFKLERVDSIFVQMASTISPEMKEHIERWNYPATFNLWEKNIQDYREFIAFRTCYIKEMLYDFFEFKDNHYLKDICDNTGVRNISKSEDIQIFPNPNNGSFILYLSDIKAYNHIEITGINGQQVLKKQSTELVLINSKEYKIDTNLSPGVYFIKISGNTNTLYRKFVVL